MPPLMAAVRPPSRCPPSGPGRPTLRHRRASDGLHRRFPTPNAFGTCWRRCSASSPCRLPPAAWTPTIATGRPAITPSRWRPAGEPKTSPICARNPRSAGWRSIPIRWRSSGWRRPGLRHVTRGIRARRPRVEILMRGDSHDGRRAAMNWCERDRFGYVFRLIGNNVLPGCVTALVTRIKPSLPTTFRSGRALP